MLLGVPLESLDFRGRPIDLRDAVAAFEEVFVEGLGLEFIDPLAKKEGLLEQEGATVLDVLLPFKEAGVIFLNLEAKHLCDEDRHLLELPIDHLHPAHRQLSVNLIGFLLCQV